MKPPFRPPKKVVLGGATGEAKGEKELEWAPKENRLQKNRGKEPKREIEIKSEREKKTS